MSNGLSPKSSKYQIGDCYGRSSVVNLMATSQSWKWQANRFCRCLKNEFSISLTYVEVASKHVELCAYFVCRRFNHMQRFSVWRATTQGTPDLRIPAFSPAMAAIV